MTASKTSIVNQAHFLLGEERINSIDDETEPARDAKMIYDDIRDEVMRAHVWRFARRRIQITADGTAPAFGYRYRYLMPTDPYCLRVLKPADPSYTDESWETEGRYILTDLPTPLAIFFIARVENEAEFDPLFIGCLAARLAEGLAMMRTDRENMREAMEQKYERRLTLARTISSQEGKKDPRLPPGKIEQARFGDDHWAAISQGY